MGLFNRKTDKEIIAEGRSLYIKGDLAGADRKLLKLASKGNDEACYWVGRISLEVAEKSHDAKRREAGRFYLEKAAKQGNKDARALLTKEFGVPNPYAEVEDKAEAKAKAEAEAELAKRKAEAPGILCHYRAIQYLELAEKHAGNRLSVELYEMGMRELEKAANLGHEGAIRRLRKEKEKVNEKALEKEKAYVLEADIVSLSFDNGEVINCYILFIFEAANGREYIALRPTEEGADTGEVYLYRYSENDEGEPILENIDDDAEFEIASNTFDEELEKCEFDEWLEE